MHFSAAKVRLSADKYVSNRSFKNICKMLKGFEIEFAILESEAQRKRCRSQRALSNESWIAASALRTGPPAPRAPPRSPPRAGSPGRGGRRPGRPSPPGPEEWHRPEDAARARQRHSRPTLPGELWSRQGAQALVATAKARLPGVAALAADAVAPAPASRATPERDTPRPAFRVFTLEMPCLMLESPERFKHLVLLRTSKN